MNYKRGNLLIGQPFWQNKSGIVRMIVFLVLCVAQEIQSNKRIRVVSLIVDDNSNRIFFGIFVAKCYDILEGQLILIKFDLYGIIGRHF